MSLQDIAQAIFDTWTKDPNAGFTNDKVPVMSDTAKAMVMAQCTAIATQILAGGVTYTRAMKGSDGHDYTMVFVNGLLMSFNIVPE